MGRAPCCSKDASLKRGAWTAEEDMILTEYITVHGDGGWKHLSQKAGLKRCGKSCRMRWLNYLRPDIKRGNISPDEEDLIIRMHSILGNRWSLIAGRLPGRTDNEIKNYWNTQLIKKLKNNGSSAPETKKINRTPSPQMEESQITRTAPVRTTAVRIEKYSNKHVGNSATSCIKDFRFQGGSPQAVSNSSKSWCELWADELLSDNDFDLLDITTNQNIVEAKSPSVDVNGQLSPFSISSFINDQIPHSQDSPENEISPFKTSIYSNDLSSPDSNLFCSASVSSEDLRMTQLEEMPSNDMEETQTVESFGSCNDQAMEEILNDMVHQVEWGGELLYFNMSSPKSLSIFQG